MSLNQGQAAFSLLELLAATVLALVTVAAVTVTITAAERLAARTARHDAVAMAASSTWEELRVLPLSSDSCPDLLSELFPHADPAQRTAEAWFELQGGYGRPAGTFFTIVHRGTIRLQVAATFAMVTTDGWSPLSAERVTGFLPGRPPSAALIVCIAAAADPMSPLITAVIPDRAIPPLQADAPPS